MATENDDNFERSSRYPGFSLRFATEAARKLYDKEKTSPVDTETAVKAMGYSGMKSGAARVMLGALRQYGLIDKAGKVQIRLSRLAVAILHGTEKDKTEALQAAAQNPTLFKELLASHSEASEENIASYLMVQKGFIDTGAKKAARTFKETISLAGNSDGVYSVDTPKQQPDSGEALGAEVPTMEQQQKPTAIAANMAIPPMTWMLSVPRSIRAELRIMGNDLRREDLLRLKKQIDFLVDSFDDDPGEE